MFWAIIENMENILGTFTSYILVEEQAEKTVFHI